MQKKKKLMRLKTRPYYALQGLVQTTGSAGGYDSLIILHKRVYQDGSRYTFYRTSTYGA